MQFINNFRGIAILLVMFVHSISTIKIGDSTTLFLLGGLLDNCTILFVVVAGYLFSYQLQAFHYKKFLRSKISAVIIPYAVISIPAILLFLFKYKSVHYWIDMAWFSEQNPVYQYFFLMITGAHLGPLWFIPMIILYYILSPVIIYVKNNNALLILFIISLIPAAYLGRPSFNHSVLQSSVYFFPSYLLGILLAEHRHIYTKLENYSALLLAAFIGSYFVIYASFELTNSSDMFFKMILAIIVLSTCYRFLRTKNKMLDMFARLSFFLFFIHGYFTGFIRAFNRYMGIKDIDFLFVFVVFSFIIFCSLSTFVVLKWCFDDKSKKWIGI